MVNIIVTLILVLIVGAALFYIRREKKRGVRCVGCPHSGTCQAGKHRGESPCAGASEQE